jgi:hypothetical protein
MKTILKNYELKQYSTFSEIIQLFNENYTPKNITDWIIYGTMKKFYESNESIYLNCILTEPNIGIFSIGLSSISTSLLSHGNYLYDITAKMPNNTILRIQSGTITVSYGITNILNPNTPPPTNGNITNEFIDGGII